MSLEFAKNFNRTWAIFTPEGKLILTIPQFMWLGIGFIFCGLAMVAVGVYLVLLTTRGV